MTQVTGNYRQKDDSVDVFVPSRFGLELCCYKPSEGNCCGICNCGFHPGADQLCCDAFMVLPAVIGTVLTWQLLWVVSFGTGSGIWKINPVCECMRPKRCTPSHEQFVELNQYRFSIHSLATFWWVLGAPKRWEQEQVTQQDYQGTVTTCSDGVGKTKALLGLDLEKDGKGAWWQRAGGGQGSQWILWLSIKIWGPEGKSWARKAFPWWRWINLGNI